MLIQCTKKLLDELKVSPAGRIEEDHLFSWHANIVKYGRRKAVVLVNDKTFYAIVLYSVKAKDLKNLGELAKQAIREVFRAEGILDEIIDDYIQRTGEVTFTKTKDRKSVGRLNRTCEDSHFMTDLIVEDSVIQVDMSLKISGLLAGIGKSSYITPNEEMFKSLEEMAGKPVFHSEAAELKVTLLLEKHTVWRRVVVPTNYNFEQLHRALQIAFNWQNSHLHDFEIYAGSGEKESPILNLVCYEDVVNPDSETPMKMEMDVQLSECLSSSIIYNYDFGDGWKHQIEVEKVVQDYKVNYPVCLHGEGSTPPEDVGGQAGYEEFLRIIGDENNPDHEAMLEWGEMQGYKEYDLREINWSFKDI
ncbi:plasmid pRiA4b ORF-3 family protein [Bacillus salacetis]|uniref:plasmid pRiA4b ORF-3 family protein n=1 Tax=Bacillus salacetis TaxID=2315464 RepID=UPI003BA183AE